MRSFRKLVLMGLAALMLCAAVASSASALTAYNKSTNAALAVGASVTGTQSGTSTLSGSFFGFTVTIQCTGSSVGGAVTTNNGGATVVGSITSATWSGCSSNLKSPCSVTAVGLPWNSSNAGGLVATSTTAVAVAPGSGTGAVNVTDCLNGLGSCTVTGGTASLGGLSNAVAGTFSTATSNLSINGGVAAKACTASGLNWVATYNLTSGGAGVGLRTP